MKRVRNTNVSATLKRAVWDTYIGPGIQDAPCPICGLSRIYQTRNSGFEAAHIIADKYCITDELSVLDLYPSCSSCNNDCSNLCLLDFLWGRERIAQLRDVIWRIYQAFSIRFCDELNQYDRMAWKVLQFLYGSKRYPAGGGIQNERQVYEMARSVQQTKLVARAAELAVQMEQNAADLRRLMEAKIAPRTLTYCPF